MVAGGEHAAFDVTRVVWQQGDGDAFMPVVHVRREGKDESASW